MCCFTAIEIPGKVKDKIYGSFGGIIKKDLFNGSIVEKENLHMTLKFFGEIREEKANELKKRLGKIKFRKISFKIGKAGFFEGNFPRVFWIGMESKEVGD